MPRGSYSGWSHAVCVCIAALAAGLPARAQYPGHVNTTEQQSGVHLRATAVFEYTGELSKPGASRLIPVAVWDGSQYQPGGLYLAQPAPLAVLSGTQYELQSEGRPKGFFNVRAAEDLAGQWIGLGSYQAPPPPAPKARPGKHMPQVVRDYDPDKPHFAHRPQDENNAAQSSPSSVAAPPVDPDRPTLHPRTGSGADAGSSSSPAKEAPVDPDRPTFHRRAEAEPAAGRIVQQAVDPDRPLLHYGAPPEQQKLDKPDALEGVPQDMQQMAAISDARTLSGDSYAYSWSNPDDPAKMKAALEAIAEQALMPPAESAAPPAAKTPAGRRRNRAAAPPAPKKPLLTDEEFKVYGLTFGGGATMVFSAHTAGEPSKYITIIAQPDFYGQPQILLKQVTSEAQMDVVPRMRLVDAVDTEGNGRANLIFELRGRSWRQFAIYRIAGGTAAQVFATQPAAL